MASQGVQRKLTAILAADVVGYSRLMGEDEVGTLAALKTHRKELIDPTIAAHLGRIVKTTGDGMLVEFPSVVEAVQCAVEIQQAMADRNAGIPEDRRMTFRVGVNLGDVIVEGDDIYGNGVNVAARLEGLAEPGGISIAATVREHIDGKVEADFEDAGEHVVKNMARPLRVWRWHGVGSPARVDDRLHGLSKRERQIAELYANGQTYKEIADALFRSPSTIRNHLNAIYKKLSISNKVELVQLVLAQRARARLPEDEASEADEGDAKAVDTDPRQAAMPPRQERRQVTLIAIELDIRDPKGGPVDIELLEANFGEFADEVRGEIERARGSVVTVLGKRIVACLGWPAAHEDDAERATRVALLTQDAARRLLQGTDLRTQCRIGLASGTIIVGGPSADDAEPAMFLGDTLVAAETLLAAAEPGQTLLIEAIGRRLSGLFEMHECGEGIELKALVVERELAGTSRFEARVGPTPLRMIGRDEELALLMERWRRTKAGEGQAVLLIGEAGIGKSRIVRAMIDETANESVRLIRYQCSPNRQDSALWPIVTQLSTAAGIAGEDTDEQKLSKLERVLEEAGPEVVEAMPLVAAFVGIGDADPQGVFAQLPPQVRRARTLATLIRYLIGLAHSSPLLVVLEDIHWADPSTNDLLTQLIEAISDQAVLILLTSRSTEHHGLGDHLHLAQLSIGRLDGRATINVVREVAGEQHIPNVLLDAIVERADGIPLFIEELAKSIVESNVVVDQNGAADHSSETPDLTIPETLYDLLMARLDRLAIDKEVTQVAACIGREFSHELLAAAAGKPEAALESTLTELVSSGLVFMRGMPPEATYLFKHALIRDEAYQSLLLRDRRRIHGSILRALEGTGDAGATEGAPAANAEASSVLSHHASLAELWPEAVRYHDLAGQAARALWAIDEAIGQFRAALEALEHLSSEQPEGEHRDATMSTTLALCECLYYSGRVRESFDLLDGSQDELAAIDDPRLRGRARYWLARLTSRIGRRGPILRLAELAIADSLSCGDKITTANAYNVLCVEHFFTGSPDDSVAAGRRAIGLLERDGPSEAMGFAYHYISIAHFFAGRFRFAVDATARVLEVADAIDHPRLACYGRAMRGWSLGMAGRHREGLRQLAESNALAPDEATRIFTVGYTGCVQLEAGALDESAANLNEAYTACLAFPSPQLAALFGAVLADALRRLGQASEAMAVAAKSLKVGRAAEAPFGVGLALRAMARLAEARSEQARAIELLEEAAAVLSSAGASFELARTYMDLASIDVGGAPTDMIAEPPYAERAELLLRRLGLASNSRGAPIGSSRA